MDKSNNMANKQTLDYEAILNAFHDDIVVVDGNGVIIKVSPTFENNYGLKTEEAVGKTVYYMEEQRIFNPSCAKIVFETGSKIVIAQKNKAGRSLLIVAVPIKDQAGKIINVVSYSIDITDLKILEEEYDKLKNDLLRYTEELNEYRTMFTSIDDITNRLPGTQHINKVINKITKYDANILISGESGVGKTTFARLIHARSSRAGQPFIEISCGAIPVNLLESELFGYEKGAFTGANHEGKIGLIAMSQNGTLFLDEIAELPLNLQVKLLKTLQDKTIMKVGGNVEMAVDFRLIAATNKNLPQLVSAGMFREDLFYRLNVIPLDIPPLRERTEDILQLIIYFVEKFNQKYDECKKLNSNAFNQLLNYSWPGNIRELENVIERLVITTDEELIVEEDLPSDIKNESKVSLQGYEEKTLADMVEEFEKKLILDAVNKYKTTVKVSEIFGMSQSTAARKIKKYT